MDELELDASKMRTRRNTWPLKRFLEEEQPPPEPFQIQYEDSNHSVHSFNPITSTIPIIEPSAFPPLECWTSDASQSSLFAYPSTSNYSYQQSTSSTSNMHTNFASLVPHNSDLWLKEEDEDELETNEQDWNKLCRQNYDSQQRKINPWGEESYADLITRALNSAPNSRLKLNEVYQWFIDNIPYFNERSSPELAAGWKNSIRHNLSLHSRFMRIQNEGAGKSSWWVINPEAKTAKNPRRRATMDASTKHMIEKKRRGARKRVEMQGSMNGLANPRKASQPEFYFNRAKDEPENDSDYDSFRSRTLSNISAPGGSQISPTFNPNNEDFAYQSWAPNTTIPQTSCNNTMNDIMNRTDQICLDTDNDYSQMSQNQQQLGVYSTMPQQISPNFQIKQEEAKPQFQHTSYQELKVVRGVDQQLQNPLLRNQFNQQNQFQQPGPQFINTNQSNYAFGNNRNMPQQQPHFQNNQQPTVRFVQQQTVTQQQIIPGMQQQQQLVSPPPMSQTTTINQQQFMRVAPNTTLPKDLQNLNTFVPPGCELDGIDEIIRQELSTSNNLQFDF